MKVAIVGCGINGAYLAWKLQKKGHEVTVFEKKSRIGKEVCSGLVSERLWWFVPKNEKLVKNKINFCNIHFPKKTVQLKFKQPFLVVNRADLDYHMASLARTAGAKIMLNSPMEKMPEGFDRIIGADGALSLVRKELGLQEPKLKLGIVNFVAEVNNSDSVDVYPVKNGFCWKIPRGDSVEYGIMAEPEEAKKEFEEFCKTQNIPFGTPIAAMIPHGLTMSKNLFVALAGDAAGLTKPWSGGGIIWGLLADDMLLKNFPNFIKYHNEVKEYFGPKIKKSKRLTDMVYFFGNKMPFALPKVKEIDSDFIF